MKRSRPINSKVNSRRPEDDGEEALRRFQRTMAAAVSHPLTPRWRMQKPAEGKESYQAFAEAHIKPNDRLSAFERLEIYNRQYWFRLLDCLYDDYPGLRAVVGEKRFLRLVIAYLVRYPSESYALRDLGNRLEQFLSDEPAWTGRRRDLALDMVRFEWAQVLAFDEARLPVVTPDDLLAEPPERLRLSLQPYLTLLTLDHPVDEFLQQHRETDRLRSEASNAREATSTRQATLRVPLPTRGQPIHLAVHRQDNRIYTKRLEADAFRLLTALAQGRTVEEACAEAIAGSMEPEADWPRRIQEWFASWSALGWLCPYRPTEAIIAAG